MVGLSSRLSAPPNAAADESWRDDDQWTEDRQGDDRSDEGPWDDDHWGGRPDHRHDHQIIFDHGTNRGPQNDAQIGRQPIPPMRPYWGTMRPYWKPIDPSIKPQGNQLHPKSR